MHIGLQQEPNGIMCSAKHLGNFGKPNRNLRDLFFADFGSADEHVARQERLVLKLILPLRRLRAAQTSTSVFITGIMGAT
jgi:hypothetical protein